MGRKSGWPVLEGPGPVGGFLCVLERVFGGSVSGVNERYVDDIVLLQAVVALGLIVLVAGRVFSEVATVVEQAHAGNQQIFRSALAEASWRRRRPIDAGT